MSTAVHPTGAYAWLAGNGVGRASDALLGCVLLILAAFAIGDARALPLGKLAALGAGFFPTFVGAAGVVVGVLLLARAAFIRRRQPAPWKLWGIVLVVAGVAVVEAILTSKPMWFLWFGPPEYAALITLILVAAIAAARWSWLRAVGMTLVGLLLSAVGIDVVTGQFRMTMGFEQLTDGISAVLVAHGLFVIGDGLVCLVSPSLWLATFAWVRTPWRALNMPMAVAIAARAVAAIGITAVCYFAFELNAQAWDIGLVLVVGLFGVACKLFVWNRPVVVLALFYGTTFEQTIRQSMMISNGDAAVFFQRQISGALLAAAIGLVAMMVVLAIRRARTAQFPATQ